MQVLSYAEANDDRKPGHRAAAVIVVLTVLVNAIDEIEFVLQFFDSRMSWSVIADALRSWPDVYAVWVSRPLLLLLDLLLPVIAWLTRSRYPLVVLVGLHCVFDLAPELLPRNFADQHWSLAMLALTYAPANLLYRWLPAIVASVILLSEATRGPLRVAATGTLVYCMLQVLNVVCWRLFLPDWVQTSPLNRTSALLEPYTQICLLSCLVLSLPVVLRWWHWMVWTSWVILFMTIIETFIPLSERYVVSISVNDWLELVIGAGSAALWSGVWWLLLRMNGPTSARGNASGPAHQAGRPLGGT